jgi:hypothetical protein
MGLFGKQWKKSVMSESKPDNGDVFPDGTVFVDISPSTTKPMFTTREDVEVHIEDAEKYIRQLNQTNAYGHNDWRLGDKKEIDTLLANQKEGALKGTFNSHRFVVDPFTDETFPPIYLSSEDLTSDEPYFRVEGEREGVQAKIIKLDAIVTIRPVRSGPV